MAYNRKFFIITGEPGIGKTTIIKNLITSLTDEGVKVAGFYTEEIRTNGTRQGFDVVTLDGVRGRLARDQKLLDGPVEYKVGKYGVLVKEFEDIVLPCLEMTVRKPSQLLVIDEVGQMELCSTSFKYKINDIFSPKTKNMIVATVPFRDSYPFIEEIRNSDPGATTDVWAIKKENRDDILSDILKEIKKTLKIR